MSTATIIVALSVLLASSAAWADNLDRFEQLMEEGQAQFERRDYEQAAKTFETAAPLAPCPTAQLWLGRSLAMAGHLGEALEALDAARAAPLGSDALRPCRVAVADAESSSATLRGRVGYLVLELAGPSSAGVEVMVNGRPRRLVPALGATPPGSTPTATAPSSTPTATAPGSGAPRVASFAYRPIAVEPGTLALVVHHREGSVARSITVAPGETLRVALELGAPPAAAAPPTAAPPSRPVSPPNVAPPPEDSPWRFWGWTALGVGSASLLAGAITGGLVLGKMDSIEDECDVEEGLCTAEGLDSLGGARSLATVSTVTFAVGIVALAGGAALLASAPAAASTEAARAAPARAAPARRALRPLLGAGPAGGWAGLEGPW